MKSRQAVEVEAGERFRFGENWARFLAGLDEEKIRRAEASLLDMLGLTTLRGKTFLDVGSGSGLFSLAARRLGATVHSFDYDPQSVACTLELKRRNRPDDPLWTIQEASVLDQDYLTRLGPFDLVYSWGVLHHTGDMWRAFENVAPLVSPGGKLFIAIYNDQGRISRYWLGVKKLYNRGPACRLAMTILHAPYLFGLRLLVRAMTGRPALERGMSLWRDMIDWLGGYPFEAAEPERVSRFFQDKGFTLERIKTCGRRMGCNEFVFAKQSP